MDNFVAAPLPDVQLTDQIREILDNLDASAVELEKAVAMPPAVYTSDEWFEFEKRALWDREWICVGHHGLIPQPGDYVTINVNEDPLIIQRGEDGQVQVMSAVCQHRGYVLSEGRGNAKVFTCPFHGWSYDMTGKLRANRDRRDSPYHRLPWDPPVHSDD